MQSPWNGRALAGKKALVVGIANEWSLAWAIAQNLHELGADLAFTFMGEALERRVRPLGEKVGAQIVAPLNVQNESDQVALFDEIEKKWGKLDILVHSIAFANREDLEGRFVTTSKQGFLTAMDVSAYSLVELSRRAEPLMKKAGGGSILTLSYVGATRAVPNYNVMGVAKAALEACVRYLAVDLGPEKIRVNSISAGPVKTLAAAGIKNFRTMLTSAQEKTPLRENIDAQEVGALGAFLCTDAGKHTTGANYFVDSGAHIV